MGAPPTIVVQPGAVGSRGSEGREFGKASATANCLRLSKSHARRVIGFQEIEPRRTNVLKVGGQ